MELLKLAQRIKQAPKMPGVYIWRNANGKPLYVGKAANLRSRLSNYLRITNNRIAAMLAKASKLTWIETPTDIEALILESQLIKKHRPKFNVMFRDDKQYFYVAITNEEFPQLILTHQHQSIKIRKPIKELLGPFTDGVPLKIMLRVLRKIFPYCTCLTARDPAKRDKQKHHLPCLNAHIGQCPGYCCLKAPATTAQKKEYARHIRIIRDVLSGKRKTIISRLAHSRPDVALKLLRVFHNARINSDSEQPQVGASRRIEGYDIANISGQYSVGAMVVFKNGQSSKKDYRIFNIKGKGGLALRSFSVGGDTDMLREMLARRLKHRDPDAKVGARWPLPGLVVIDGGKAQLNVARKIFGARTRIVAITKDERHRASKIIGDIESIDKQLAFAVDAEAHRFAISHYRRKHRKSMK